MQLGDFPVQGRVIVIEASRLGSPDASIDGLIGNNLLQQLAVDFDFQKHQITLLNPGNLSSDNLKSLDMLDATVLPKATSDPSFFPLKVRLNDQVDVNLHVDTGSADTILPLNVVKQLKLKPLSQHIDESDTPFGRLKTKNVKVPTFAIGPLVIKDQVVEYSEHEIAQSPPGIGVDVLSRYHLLIDFPANKLYLKPVSPVPPVPSTTQGTQR